MKQRAIAVFLTVACLLTCLVGSVWADGTSTAASDSRHNVAVVATGAEYLDIWEEFGWGTGFFVGESGEPVQYLVTNHHVVEYYLELGAGEPFDIVLEGEQPTVVSAHTAIRVYFGQDDYIEASVVESDSIADLAVLKLVTSTDKRAAVKFIQPVLVLREVGRHPVKNDADAAGMQLVHKIHKILRLAEARGGRIIAADLISPRPVERMLGHRH